MPSNYDNYINNVNYDGFHKEGDCSCKECLCNLVPHGFQGSACQRRCLEYLVQYGGDLKKCTYQQQETTKDIAVRRGKSSIVDVIDEYCEILSRKWSCCACACLPVVVVVVVQILFKLATMEAQK